MKTKTKDKQPELLKPDNEVLSGEVDQGSDEDLTAGGRAVYIPPEVGKAVYVPPPPPQPNDPGSWIASLVGQGADPAKLTQLYDLYERYNKDQAVKAYNEAMQKAQAEMPTIVCDQVNQQTNSKYPSVENINRKCKPVYTRQGFALSFGEGKSDLEGMIRTTCTVMHSGGHSKEFFIDLPTDTKGIAGKVNKTDIHGKLSAKTYAQSKQLREIFNLTVADVADDNDGNGATTINEEQVNYLNELIAEIRAVKEFDFEKFLAFAQVKVISDIQQSDYAKIRDMLTRKRDQK